MINAQPISVEKCREKLGEACADLSDEQVAELRDALYGLCNAVLDDHLDKKLP